MDLNIDNVFLNTGSHSDPSEGVCAMEMVAYIAKEPHTDRPVCACPVITAFVISLNDSWTDEQRQALKPFLPRIIGTRKGVDAEVKRGIMTLDWTMRAHRPLWLEAAGFAEIAAQMRALPEIVDEASFKPAMELQMEAIAAARSAWDAWDAWSARSARSAWAAWDAWAARSASGGLVALNAGNSLGPDATDEQRKQAKQAGMAALESVADSVRAGELELLDRMINA